MFRDETKYDRLIAFGQVLPSIRRRTEKDLARAGLPREKILATVVRLLETTLIRVGNEEYARNNDSFGLTTMRDHHVDVSGSSLRFEFRVNIRAIIFCQGNSLLVIASGGTDGQELQQGFRNTGIFRDALIV